MSTSLYYRKYRPEPNGKELSFELKKAISQKYWGHDGSLSGDWTLLGLGDVEFLEGIVAAGIEDAQKLIDEIHRNGSVEISLQQ